MINTDVSNIINRLCSEFQSVWIIDIKTLNMNTYKVNKSTANLLSLTAVETLSTYPQIREWYIQNCIASFDQKRVDKQTTVDVVLEKISDGRPYCVEYSRINGDSVNFNQIYFAKYEPDEAKLEHFILGFRDIDMLKIAERDNLTGVYTRLSFFQKAEYLLQSNPDEQYDLMLSDIVDFKSINDTYGVTTGDKILQWSGNFIQGKIPEDALAGRYGGDQFVILATHDFISSVAAAEMNFNLSHIIEESGLPRAIIKFGIYENITHAKSIISACDKAHIALNSIKHQYGKYIAYYDDTLRRSLDIEHKIENGMHEALISNQFKVYYQPKHNAVNGQLIGAEALIRWVHPEYGFMSPADFIPLFEKNGFIVEADFYVWRHTCENLSKWKRAGLNVVPVSVNASKLTFAQKNLLDYLTSITSDNDISSDLLHIEITETLMTDDIDSLVEKLEAIKSQGHQIELDDFGSGYSSINLLSALPLDVVKLDMSFMRQFGDVKRSKVLAACIKLAKELGYKTISEGVEHKEQSDLLSVLGVDAIQGYYYSKPLPEEEFEEYIKKYT